MIVDFQMIDIYDRQPTLVLKAPSGKVIQTLGYAHNIECSFNYSETSKLTFDLPAYVNGEPTPNYDKVVGEMIIDLVGWGLFILQNPSTTNTGIQETKSCTAYSLEYELTHRQMSLEEGTYNFWDQGVTAGDSPTTLMGIILQYCPGWTMGDVDDALLNRYRTFDQIQDNAYNVMMNTLQVPYNCIFSFDTYNRKINVIDANSDAPSNPIFISLDNLAKEIEINEESENLVTVLDVYGADDVDIRSANPLGTNKIYNLDYFMNEVHFDQETIDKWDAWKEAFEQNRQAYYDLSIRRAMKTSEKVALQARKTDEEGVLSAYETDQSVHIRAIAIGDDTGEHQTRLDELNEEIQQQRATIAATQLEINEVQSDLDDILDELKDINEATAFESFFIEEELAQLQHYFIENALEESSFAVNEYSSFVDESQTVPGVEITATVSDSQVTTVDPREGTNEEIYSFIGGTVEVSYGSYTDANEQEHPKYTIVADIKRGSAEMTDTTEDDVTTRRLTETIVIGAGTKTDNEENSTSEFMNGTLIILGKYEYGESDVADTEINVLREGSSLTCSVSEGDMYLTSEATLFEQYDVELDLFEYAQEELRKMAYPTYTFKVDTSNFLALEDFKQFASQLSLGQRLYIDIGTRVLEPILVGVDMSFEDLTDFSLSFSDTYHGSDNAFGLVDLLQKSVSMGHKLDLSKYSYGAYINSGADTAVKGFMTSALDASRNAVVNAANQAVKIDESGIRLRDPDEHGGYSDEQMWMINNNIVLTDDGWETAKVAIGHFRDENLITTENPTGDAWGIAAPTVIGTLIAGESLVIESNKVTDNGRTGETSLFRVDGNGASLYNADFELITPLGQTSGGANYYGNIVLDPELGIGIGTYIGNYTKQNVTRNGHTGQVDGIIFSYQSNGETVREWNHDITSGGVNSYDGNTNFWVDIDGSIHFKGTLEGADGQFTGSLKVGDPDNSQGNGAHGLYIDTDGNLSLGGIYRPGSQTADSSEQALEAPFYVDAQGHMYATSGTFTGIVSADDLKFYDPIEDEFKSVLVDHNKINSNFLDLGGIQLAGETGDISMTGVLNLGGVSEIVWGNNIPGSTYEFSNNGIDWVEGDPNKITVAVWTRNNIGLKEASIEFHYDKDVFTYRTLYIGGAIPLGYQAPTATNDTQNGVVTVNLGDGSTSLTNTGILFSLEFATRVGDNDEYNLVLGGTYTTNAEIEIIGSVPVKLGMPYGEKSPITISPFEYDVETRAGDNPYTYYRTKTVYTKRYLNGTSTEVIRYSDPMLTSSALPSYIKKTHIDMHSVTSPSFFGNQMNAIDFNIVSGYTTDPTTGEAIVNSTLGSIGQINGWAGEYLTDPETGEYYIHYNESSQAYELTELSTVGVGLKKDQNHYVICTSLGARMQSGALNYGSATGWSNIVTMAQSAYMSSGKNLYFGLENSYDSGDGPTQRMIGGYFISTPLYEGGRGLDHRDPVSYFQMTSGAAKLVHENRSNPNNVTGAHIAIDDNVDISTQRTNSNISISASADAALQARTGQASLLGNSYTLIQGSSVEVKDNSNKVRLSSGSSKVDLTCEVTDVAGSQNINKISCSGTGISLDSYSAGGLTMFGDWGIALRAGYLKDVSITSGVSGVVKIYYGSAESTNVRVSAGADGSYLQWGNRVIQATNTEVLVSNDSSCYFQANNNGCKMYAGEYAQYWCNKSTGIGQQSDRRSKENIEYEIDGDLVDKLKPAKFNFIGAEFKQFGFIAQDVQEVIPEIITYNPDDNKTLGLRYVEFIPFLTAKLQKHTRIIKEQEERIARLEQLLREVKNDE